MPAHSACLLSAAQLQPACTDMRMHRHTCTDARMHRQMSAQTDTCTDAWHTQMHARMHKCRHAHTNTCTHRHMHICMLAQTFSCTDAHVYMRTHAHTYACTDGCTHRKKHAVRLVSPAMQQSLAAGRQYAADSPAVWRTESDWHPTDISFVDCIKENINLSWILIISL